MTGEGDGRCNFHQLSARRLARQRRPAARSAGPGVRAQANRGPRLREQARLRPGHRRLQRGASARSQGFVTAANRGAALCEQARSIWALPTTARRFDGSADADIAKAKQLDASAGRWGGSGENDTGSDASSDHCEREEMPLLYFFPQRARGPFLPSWSVRSLSCTPRWPTRPAAATTIRSCRRLWPASSRPTGTYLKASLTSMSSAAILPDCGAACNRIEPYRIA